MSLIIADGSGKVVATIPMADASFEHVFVHSIHRSLVEERFRVEADGTFRLYEVRYEDCGVGMPSELEGSYRLEAGSFVVGMDRALRGFSLFVSPVPGHGIVVNGIFHHFTEWAAAGEALRLSACAD